MHPVQQTDHAGAALALLAEQFKNKANIAGFMRVWLRQIQDLENFFWQLLTERWIDSAIGAQLDVLGRIVGEPRGNSPDDTDYRLRVRARIRINMSSGTIEDIYAVFRAVLGNVAGLNFTPSYPAGFEFKILDPIPANVVDLYAGFLKHSRAAGVGGNFIWSPASDAESFTFEPLAAFVSVDNLVGDDLTIYVTSTAGFPTSGVLRIDTGTGIEEVSSYLNLSPTAFLEVSHFDYVHEIGAYIILEPDTTTGKGFGDDSNPAIGGQLSGAVGP